jgi:hypothetical protein
MKFLTIEKILIFEIGCLAADDNALQEGFLKTT